jgi:AcrR family transcriptional regulator
MAQAQRIVEAARRLTEAKGDSFTTQEVVKEAGVALQTFYRHFAGKDQLILALLEDMIAESCQVYEEQARELPTALDRLRHHVTVPAMRSITADRNAGARFITGEHWRLHRLFPEELAQANKPFTDLIAREVRAAQAEGTLAPQDADRDAWLVTKLVLTVYHHYAYAPADLPAEDIAEHLWGFCLAALGGAQGPAPAPAAGGSPDEEGA